MSEYANQPRLGVLVLERNTGRPLAGVPILAVAETVGRAEDDEVVRQIPLGLLASDHAGYASFDPKGLGLLAGVKRLEHIWVYAYGREENRVDALDTPLFGAGGQLVVIHLDPVADPKLPKLKLPSLQNPSPFDRLISPASFATQRSMTIGEGDCAIPLPTDKATHVFRLRQVVRKPDPPVVLQPVSDMHCIQLKHHHSFCVRDGWVNEYKISWHPKGHSLGQLVYSVPLAPCESVNLAVIDWSRRDEAMRQEIVTFREDLSHELRRDRTIEETVAASLEEWQGGGSIMGGVAGSYGLDVGMSISGAIGGAYATSSGDRSVETDTTQRLSDRIVQASTAVRNLQSTVVVSGTQQEHEAIQTRTVTNHNHCHALTVMYYEVLRHFQVVTEWISRTFCLLIQYPLYTFKWDDVIPDDLEPVPDSLDSIMERGVEEFVLQHRLVLERALLDRRLRRCFEALAKKHCSDEGIIAGELPLNGSDYFLESLTLIADVERNSDIQFITVNLDTPQGMIPLGASDLGLSGRVVMNQPVRLAPAEELTYNLAPPDPHNERTLYLQPASPVRWSEIRTIQIATPDQHGWLRLAHVYAKTTEGAETWILYDGDISQTMGPDGDEMALYLDVNPRGGAKAKLTLTPEELCCVEQLLLHLQANRHYYSQAIWLNEDANARAMRFDAIGYHGGRLLDFIENRPLAVYGDYVAFPKRPEDEVEDQRTISEELEPEYCDVVLPARGVFAEAQLGHCNACEERDITRFWDWSESPCPERAPEIAPIVSGSRAQEPDLRPSAMPSPIVNIVNPPAAPDPTGMAAALNLLGTADIFRDMSGLAEVSALLQELAAGTISLEEASNRAEKIKNRLSAGGQGGVSGGAAGRPTPQEQHDQLQVYRNAEEHGELAPQEQRAMGRAYLQNAQYHPYGEDMGPSGEVFSSEGFLGPPSLDNIQRGRILFANFTVDRTDLTQEHMTALDQLIEAMQDSSEAFIECIEGRASQTGPEANNEELASGRANVVAQYLIDHGFNPEQIGRVVGYGSRAPLLDMPDVEIDVNRSALVTYSLLVDWPEESKRKPAPREGGSRQWAIRLELSGGASHEGIGGAFATGELRKGGVGGEVRHGSFQGFGLGLGASTPGAGLPGVEWTPFTTDAPYDFEDFDGTLARLTSAGAGFLVGYSLVWISFPNLGANSIYVGGMTLGAVGADIGTNPLGWWNVEGM